MSMPKLSVVIPMYNENEICAECAEKLTAALNGYFPDRDYEIVFSDDGSTDGCRGKVDSLGLDRVRTVGYSDNRGKGSAVREGLLACRGEHAVYTDCDLAYGTDAIFEIYEKSLGHDIAIGSRVIHPDGYTGYTRLRKLMSKMYLAAVRLLSGFKYSDSQCGLKCLSRKAIDGIMPQCVINSFAFDLEILILADKQKLDVVEYPAKIICNRDRGSKVSPVKDAVKMIKDVMKIKKLHK